MDIGLAQANELRTWIERAQDLAIARAPLGHRSCAPLTHSHPVSASGPHEDDAVVLFTQLEESALQNGLSERRSQRAPRERGRSGRPQVVWMM